MIGRRDRRALLLGASVIALGAVVTRLGPAAIGRIIRARQKVSVEVSLLTRSRAELRQVPLLEDSAAAVRERFLAIGPDLVPGGNEVDAGEALRGLLTIAADRNRVRLTSVEFLPDSVGVGRVRRVSIRASLESDLQGLLETLAAIEAGQPVIAVASLQLLAGDAPDSARTERLTGTAVLRGWYVESDSGSSGGEANDMGEGR